jgi:hypothetical protein
VLKGYRDIEQRGITDPSFCPTTNNTTSPAVIPSAIRAETLRHTRADIDIDLSNSVTFFAV